MNEENPMEFIFKTIEEADAKLWLHAGEMFSAIDEARMYIRGILKHGDPSDETEKHLEHIRDLLCVPGVDAL